MKLRAVVLLLISTLLVGVVSPAVAPEARAAPQYTHVAAVHARSHAAAFDETRFLAHLAVAAFLVHYVYKKYKDGKLGRTHIPTDLKAAAAALIALHEKRTAYGIGKASNSKTLQTLISPMAALTGTLGTLSSKLKHGDTSQIATANSQESSLQMTAGKNGYSYKDQQPSGFSGF